MEFKIRKACYDDVDGIIAAHRRSIREICRADYTSDQIDIWSGRDFKVEIWRQNIDNDQVQVVVGIEQGIHGFCHFGLSDDEKLEVKGLYLCPEVLRMGFGSQLIDHAITHASKLNRKQIIAYSTITAQKFYEYKGFRNIAERSLVIQGMKLPCIEMLRITKI